LVAREPEWPVEASRQCLLWVISVVLIVSRSLPV